MIANRPLTITHPNVTNSGEREQHADSRQRHHHGLQRPGNRPSHRLSPCLPPKPNHVGGAREGALFTVPDHHDRPARVCESDAPLWRYTLEQSADDVNALLDQLAIQQALFVGLSMGGYILFAFYRKYANRVKGLILADTKAQADTAEGREVRFQMAQTAYKQGPSAIADIMIPKFLSLTTIQGKIGSRPASQSHDRRESHQRDRWRLDGNGRATRLNPALKPDHLPYPNHCRRIRPSHPAIRRQTHGRSYP